MAQYIYFALSFISNLLGLIALHGLSKGAERIDQRDNGHHIGCKYKLVLLYYLSMHFIGVAFNWAFGDYSSSSQIESIKHINLLCKYHVTIKLSPLFSSRRCGSPDLVLFSSHLFDRVVLCLRSSSAPLWLV